ncbi:MAG: hypothetical protein P8I61_04585 [Opitutae bacterium]|jgi:hypothetical protein|nr:hypothetical protein [Opitutae bacterium]
MADPKSNIRSAKSHQHFFANTLEYGIQASFANADGRKNFLIPQTSKKTEEAPLAVESFSMTPEQYHSLMERVSTLYH